MNCVLRLAAAGSVMGALVDLSTCLHLPIEGGTKTRGCGVSGPRRIAQSQNGDRLPVRLKTYIAMGRVRGYVPTPVLLASFSFSLSPCLPAWSDVAPSALSFLDVLNEGHDALA